MAFKPNYNHQRAERARTQRNKREDKLRLRQERSAERKAAAAPDVAPGQDAEAPVPAALPGDAERKG